MRSRTCRRLWLARDRRSTGIYRRSTICRIVRCSSQWTRRCGRCWQQAFGRISSSRSTPARRTRRHLNDLPDVRGLWLVGEGSLTPSVFPQFTGRTFIYKVSHHEPWPWLADQGADRAEAANLGIGAHNRVRPCASRRLQPNRLCRIRSRLHRRPAGTAGIPSTNRIGVLFRRTPSEPPSSPDTSRQGRTSLSEISPGAR